MTLIFSPRNMASMRARRPDSSASCKSRAERLVGDAVLGVIQEEPRGLGGEPLAAAGIVGEQTGEDGRRASSGNELPGPSRPGGHARVYVMMGFQVRDQMQAECTVPIEVRLDQVRASATICWASATMASRWLWSRKLSA